MAKITELPQGNGLSANDVFPYVDVPNSITKKYPASALLSALASVDSSDFIATIMENTSPGIRHRMFYGGRNLGNTVSDEQLNAIKNGSFKGLLVGDYWSIDNVNWTIVDMDYFLYTGSVELKRHHLVIMPNRSIYRYAMNETNTTENGYLNSNLRTNIWPSIVEICEAAFPSIILEYKYFETTKTDNGRPTYKEWVTAKVELPAQAMIFGFNPYTFDINPNFPNQDSTMCKQPFALVNLVPTFAAREFWLRDAISATAFAGANNNGAYFFNAGNTRNICPFFLIG